MPCSGEIACSLARKAIDLGSDSDEEDFVPVRAPPPAGRPCAALCVWFAHKTKRDTLFGSAFSSEKLEKSFEQ